MLIWVLAEAPHIVSTLGLISSEGFGTIGLTFHMLSMTAFALFMGAKSYNFLRTPVHVAVEPMPPAPREPTVKGMQP